MAPVENTSKRALRGGPYPSPTLSTSSRRRQQAPATASPSRKPAAKGRLLHLTGAHLPAYNDWQGSAVDDASHYLYIFGGVPEWTQDPTSHLFRLNLSAQPMRWDDLTNMIRPSKHFSPPTVIPPRSGAGVAFYRRAGHPYLIIFGGWWGTGPSCSEFITVDLCSLTWERHPHVSTGVLRIEPAVVVVGDRVCVFGGRSGKDFGRGKAESTFCVIRFDDAAGRWDWEFKDVQGPSVPLGSQLGAVPWELGVLVVPGRCEEGDIKMQPPSFLNYDPDRNRWGTIAPKGDWPPDAVWMNLRSAGPKGKEVPHLCVWYATTKKDPETGGDCLTCDIWAIDKGVMEDKMRCLKVATPIWKRRNEADLELFHMLGDGRLLMLGKKENEPASWNMCLDVTEAAAKA